MPAGALRCAWRLRRRGAVRLPQASLGSRNNRKDHPAQGDAYGLTIKPGRQAMGMLFAVTVTAGDAVRNGAAGLAVPGLIERDHETFSEPRFDLVPNHSFPLSGRNNYLQQLFS